MSPDFNEIRAVLVAARAEADRKRVPTPSSIEGEGEHPPSVMFYEDENGICRRVPDALTGA